MTAPAIICAESQVDQAAIDAMAEVGTNIRTEFPKPWTDEVVRAADVVITMGCVYACSIRLRRCQDRGLAAPRRADDRHHLARLDRQLDTAQRPVRQLAGAVHLLLAGRPEDRGVRRRDRESPGALPVVTVMAGLLPTQGAPAAARP